MGNRVGRTDLIPLTDLVGDEDPELWLDRIRKKLLFRSRCAMHKAIAEAAGLKYDCVHKALSGRQKARRIHPDVKRCLDGWSESAERGEGLDDIDEKYRGVSVTKLQMLLSALERRFRTKEDLYRFLSDKTGITTASVRRYFQARGSLRYVPLKVYELAMDVARDNGPADPVQSYLEDDQIRRAAEEIARKANEALRKWQYGQDDECEIEYKQLRRMLIATLKEQISAVPALV